MNRVEGQADKVTGHARYAYEYPPDASGYAFAVQAPVASGVVRSVDASAALAMPGVLAVLTCTAPAPSWARWTTPNWPSLADPGDHLPRAAYRRGGRRHAGERAGRRGGRGRLRRQAA